MPELNFCVLNEEPILFHYRQLLSTLEEVSITMNHIQVVNLLPLLCTVTDIIKRLLKLKKKWSWLIFLTHLQAPEQRELKNAPECSTFGTQQRS